MNSKNLSKCEQKSYTGTELKLKICRELASHTKEDFFRFIFNSKVTQINYEKLLIRINEIEDEKYDTGLSDIGYDIEPLREKEVLIGNTVRITEFPSSVFIAKISYFDKELYPKGGKDLFSLYRGNLISLVPIQNLKKLHEFLDLETMRKTPFRSWLKEDSGHYGVVKQLIKNYVVYMGNLIGARYDDKTSCLYFPHKNKHQLKHKIKGKQVSKIYRNREGKVNFVEHVGYKIQVQLFGEEFYLIINPVRLFTKDGRIIIRGKNAKKLHEKFPPIFDFNNTLRDRFTFILSQLSLNTYGIFDERYFLASQPISIEIDWKPASEIKFDASEYTPLDEFLGDVIE